jgi:hypothetical protein
MNIATVNVDRLNEALQFLAEQLKPVTYRIATQMIQGAIVDPEKPKDVPAEEKAVEGSAEGETNG